MAYAIVMRMNKAVADRKEMKKSPAYSGLSPILDPKARLAAWESVRGIWKNRTPDPIKELSKMRKEWERTLPALKSSKKK